MPSCEVKHRKGKSVHNGETNETPKACSKEERKKEGSCMSGPNNLATRKSSKSLFDLKTVVSFLSLSASFLLAWLLLQQNSRFNDVEEKYRYLHEKAADLLLLQEKFNAVSKTCEDVQALLQSPEVQSSLYHLSHLEQEVARLRDWSSGLAERRLQLQENISGLIQAIDRIENRTLTVSNDMTVKVASVRTDVRRIGGLESEMNALLTQTGELEERLGRAEKTMVKRIGELLASSIDRVSGLKSAAEKNTQSLEQMRNRIPELSAIDRKLSDRMLALESGRAKLMRTVTFAIDLKPKVNTIKRDFAMLEPQLADLTLRIGHLAEDVMKREEDIMQVKESLASFVASHGDHKQSQEELAIEITSDPSETEDTTDHTAV